MAETKTETKTKTKTDAEDEVGPVTRPAAGDADASYVDPDLSFQDGVGELPDEEKEWHEARDKAREEGVKAAEEGEEKALEERRKRAKEERENRPVQAPVLTTEGPATTASAAAQPK